MHSWLSPIQSADTSIYYFLCRFHGGRFLDRFFSHLESDVLLKSGLLIALYYYFWFREGDNQEERRVSIIAILAGTLASLFLVRMIATFAPFRIRPAFDTSLLQHALSVPAISSLAGWSSFPSDHAAYLTALGFGLIWLSPRLKVPISLYVAVGICLPRMYLGLHYASDILVGAAVGVACVFAAVRIKAVRTVVARPMLAFANAKPQVFYAAAFLVLFELATMFPDVVEARSLLHAAFNLSRNITLAIELTLLASLCGAWIVFRRRVPPVPPPVLDAPAAVVPSPALKAKAHTSTR